MYFIYNVYMTVMGFKKVLIQGGWVGGDELYPVVNFFFNFADPLRD